MRKLLKNFPFIAITRGLLPDESLSCVEILYSCGFRIVETPLNSPTPFKTIETMVQTHGHKMLIGAGTVVTTAEVEKVASAGARLIVSPICDEDIIAATKQNGMVSLPGVTTPTEAIRAIQAGADGLKLFPAEMISPQALRAIKTILPKNFPLIPVGGIDHENWQSYFTAGATGVGVGSSLYVPGMTSDQLRSRGELLRQSWLNLAK